MILAHRIIGGTERMTSRLDSRNHTAELAKRVAATVRPRSEPPSRLCPDQTLINQELLLLLLVPGEPNASASMVI